MLNNERDFKSVWIPKEIWLDSNLTLNEKYYLSFYEQLQNERLADEFMLTMISKTTLIKIKNRLIKKELLKKTTSPIEAKEIVLSNKNKGAVCEWCGCKTNAIQKHHFPIPKSKGGKDTVNICPNCHYEYHLIIKDN